MLRSEKVGFRCLNGCERLLVGRFSGAKLVGRGSVDDRHFKLRSTAL